MQKYLFTIFILLTSAFLVACNKPNPTPELIDPIYSDLNRMAEEAKKSISEARAAVDDAQKEKNEAKPQTGQIEYANKRLREANQRLVQVEQMAKYLEIRAESRLKYDRENYLLAWKSKKEWPDPSEYQAFKEAEKAHSSKSNWDIKARLKEAGVGPKEVKVEKKEGGH